MQSPVHSGGNRLGISPNFPCRPQWAPATVQPDVRMTRVEVAINWSCKELVFSAAPIYHTPTRETSEAFARGEQIVHMYAQALQIYG